jgi:hypothetical protein
MAGQRPITLSSMVTFGPSADLVKARRKSPKTLTAGRVRAPSERSGMAMELELTNEQALELQLLLDGALGELSHEIADTDNPQFRQRLRDRRVALQAIAHELRQVSSS